MNNYYILYLLAIVMIHYNINLANFYLDQHNPTIFKCRFKTFVGLYNPAIFHNQCQFYPYGDFLFILFYHHLDKKSIPRFFLLNFLEAVHCEILRIFTKFPKDFNNLINLDNHY